MPELVILIPYDLSYALYLELLKWSCIYLVWECFLMIYLMPFEDFSITHTMLLNSFAAFLIFDQSWYTVLFRFLFWRTFVYSLDIYENRSSPFMANTPAVPI
jgi:hypothetical protein